MIMPTTRGTREDTNQMSLYVTLKNTTYFMDIAFRKHWIYRSLACFYDESACISRKLMQSPDAMNIA